MESECSLSYSQVPATCPCVEPAQSSPNPTPHFLEIHLNIIFPSTSGYPQRSASLMLPTKSFTRPSALPYALHAPPILYNILIEFSIPMKLVRLIKMCLTETYSRVRVGKNLCDVFPIRNGLKRYGY